jgi:hypothetical protein
MPKFFLALLLIIAIAGLSYFIYPTIKGRYFGSATTSLVPPPETAALADTASQNDPVSEEITPSSQNVTEKSETNNTLETVTMDDCSSECKGFTDKEKLSYCQEICGLQPVTQRESATACADLNGIQKDTCFRDFAVTKKDFVACDKINDQGIKKNCQNRITEELLGS